MAIAIEKTVTFSHQFGQELDLDTQKKYDATAITVPNLAGDQRVAERAKRKVEETLIQSFEDRVERETEWEIFIALYRGFRITGSVRSNADVNVPETRKAVEVWTRRLHKSTFLQQKWFEAEGTTIEEDKRADDITEFMLDQIRRDKFPLKWKHFLRQLCILGTSAAIVNWDYVTRRVNFSERIIKDKKERGLTVSRKVEVRFPKKDSRVFVLDNPKFQPLSMFDFAADPHHWDVQEGTFAGHRTVMTRIKLKQLQSRGAFLNVEKLDDLGGLTPAQRKDLVGRFLISTIEPDHATHVAATDEFRIVEYWGPFQPTEGSEECEYVITMEKEHGVVLQVRLNPLWHGRRPYVVGQFTHDERASLYGVGVVEPIATLQIELNDTRNMLLNAKDLIVNPMLEIGEDADIPDEMLFAQAGRILRVRQVGQIRPVGFADPTLTALRTESITKADILETANTPLALVGAPQRGDETATENVNRTREANSAMEDVLLDLGDQVLQPYVDMVYFLNLQFIREERVFRKLGRRARSGDELFKVLQPEDLVGQYEFQVLGLRDSSLKGLRSQQLRGMLDALSRYVPLGLTLDVNAVGRKFAEDIFDDQTARLFFPDLEQEPRPTPQEEHEFLQLGRRLDVDPRDDHQLHLQAHQAVLQNKSSRLNMTQHLHLDAHIQNHIIALQRQIQEINMAVRASGLQAELAQQQPGAAPTNGQGGSRPVQVVPNQGVPQAPEAQQAQIGGQAPGGFGL